MSFAKTISIITILLTFLFSCKKDSLTNDNVQKEKLVANYKKSEFKIKGMTCEIGCAKLIQSKLSKIDGVKFIKVSFKDHLGMLEYDSNKLTPKKIKTIVDNIAGGNLYTVTSNNEVSEFQILKKTH
ncbi:MAG: cation transporter [Flavobacteriaceae bacterium]|nr:cation transporter [Flavobacteriaceae bacterium]